MPGLWFSLHTCLQPLARFVSQMVVGFGCCRRRTGGWRPVKTVPRQGHAVCGADLHRGGQRRRTLWVIAFMHCKLGLKTSCSYVMLVPLSVALLLVNPHTCRPALTSDIDPWVCPAGMTMASQVCVVGMPDFLENFFPQRACNLWTMVTVILSGDVI